MPSLPLVLALKTLESLINQALRYDPATRMRLSAHDGKCVFVEMQSPRLSFGVQILDGGVRLKADLAERPHATIEAPSFELIKQAFKREPELIGGPVQVGGNTQLVHELYAIARDLDVDWEEPLSRLFGDVAAAQLGRRMRGLFGFAQKTAKTFFLNTGEYLQEEKQLLPVRWELDEFLRDAQDLRADAERVEARLGRLEQKLKKLNAKDA